MRTLKLQRCAVMQIPSVMILPVFLLIAVNSVSCYIILSADEVTMEVGTNEVVEVQIRNLSLKSVEGTLEFEVEYHDVIQVTLATSAVNSTYIVRLDALNVGMSGLSIIARSRGSEFLGREKAFLLVKVHKCRLAEWLSRAVGWLYFLMWSICYYPQIYTNYKRKSVVGLNFDYLLFNITGYIMYSTFNLGLYFIPAIQDQYWHRHPQSLNPVRPSDMFFSTHGILATLTTILQCFIYRSDNQKISKTANIFVGLYALIIFIFMVFVYLRVVLWLDVLYLCSYIKLCATAKMYAPQVYMNYKRRSTEGWSIGGIIMDFIGGILSIFQMVLDGYNYGDWAIFAENPAKFGLGLLAIAFDITFILQHYVFYTKTNFNGETKLKTFSQ